MMNNWTIYMYTFPNGKRYIGATKQPLCLRQGSLESGWAKYRNCRLLWEAIQEFGVESIEQSILFQGEITNEEASEMERHYIALYKTNANRYRNPSFGYNLGDGGEGLLPRQLSEERRRVLAAQMKNQGWLNRGKCVSEETRRRQSVAKLGTKRGPMSEETKKKIGLANSLENMSPEERQHRSDSKKQPVYAYNSTTGEEIIFDSGEDAAGYFGVRSSSITRWINGTRTPRNGFRFSKIAVGVIA